MPRNALEWRILPSKKQRYLDTAFLVVTSLILWVLLGSHLTIIPLALLPLILLAVVWKKHRQSQIIGVNEQGWWLQESGQTRPVAWLTGSQIKPSYVRLVWGFWPWQVISVHPDSFRHQDDFRRFKFELYGEF